MKISIVTPSYNQAGFIVDALKSVQEQQHLDCEHIVVDNCSSDDTLAILNKYPHVRLLREPDYGQSDALNKGFKMAQGDIIGWLNADDRYLPQCFKTVTDYFTANPQCDVLYGDYRLIDGNGDVLSVRKEVGFDLFMLKYLHVLCIPSTTTFFRRRIFDEGHYLNTSYHYAMDYEFFLRLALEGYHFEHCPSLLADFRTHPDSKSQRETKVQKDEMEKALIEKDMFLNRLKGPWQGMARNSLMVVARSKRCGMKFLQGAYFQ